MCNRLQQHFGEIKNEVFFKERRLLRLKGPVGETCLVIIVCTNKCFKVTTHICDDQQNLETPYKNVKMFPISSCKISLCKMYFIGIVSDCISRKIIRSTPNRKNLFGRKMKSSLNYLFIRLTDVIFRNKHHELQLLLKLENGDVRL